MTQWQSPRDIGHMLLLSARLVAGRRFWLFPLLPLAWTLFQITGLLLGWRGSRYGPADVQFTIVGFPLIVLAIVLGVRIVATEIEQRTLEVTYTVPGGTYRVLLWKLAAAISMLLIAELLLAVMTQVLFTSVPPVALYGALQGAVFYLMLAMALGALVRNELTAVLAMVPLLTLNLPTAWMHSRFSPLFNPLKHGADAQVPIWMLQNYVGFALVIVLIALAVFARVERREKLLS